MTDIPHFAFPFRFTHVAGQVVVAVNEQDSYDEIFDCVQVISRWRRGQRIDQPEFGITDQLFSDKIDTGLIVTEIEEWEPRASEVITEERDRFDGMISYITDEVRNLNNSGDI